VAGSIVTRQEELQASTLPAQALLLIPYKVSVAAPKGRGHDVPGAGLVIADHAEADRETKGVGRRS
jgi:hypothetical protein